MNERERILDLVKKGIISSEEGLVLLENLSKKNANTTPNAQPTNYSDQNDDEAADREEAEQEAAEARAEAEEERKEAEEERREAQQEAEEARQDALDDLEDQLSDLKDDLADHNEDLAETEQKIAAVSKQIQLDQEHITVIDAMEDLDSLTDEKRQERVAAKSRVVELQQTVDNLQLTRDELQGQIDQLNQQISQVNRKRIKINLNFDHLRDNTNATLNDFGEKLGDFGTQFGNKYGKEMSDFGEKVGDLGSQFGGYMRDAFKNVMDNIDWNDVTFKVPGLATTSFKHDFVFENCGATILDVKNANGDVTLNRWEQPDIKVAANIKLYGKMDEADKLTAFTDRSRIDVNDDHFIFQVPNKRIQANLDIYLPARVYDHINLNLLNGSINIGALQAKDVYLKTTNGKISITDLQATMVEAEDVNGAIDVLNAELRELLLSTVNGNATVVGQLQAGKLSTVHGNVKATLNNDDLHRLEASSVNGNVKIAVPASLNFFGTAKTSFGQVNTRSFGLQIDDQRSTTGANMSFSRGDHPETKLQLSSTSGSIYLKDNQ